MWGAIDADEYPQYRHYDNPANGDLQEVVPGKFVALKGPVATPDDAPYHDDARGARSFSPAFCADILRGMGVTAVVRLNEPRYPAEALTSRGLAHHSLAFPDCACPPDAVVAAFLRIVDAAPGAVAARCHAGLGRTGTLIALHLTRMRSCGFGAREAMGWLRIMRPGSVMMRRHRGAAALPLRRRRRAAGPPAGPGRRRRDGRGAQRRPAGRAPSGLAARRPRRPRRPRSRRRCRRACSAAPSPCCSRAPLGCHSVAAAANSLPQ
jgi:hypothetical protein